MTKPSKPRTGRKRRGNRPTLPSRPSAGRPNGDLRRPAAVPPTGATTGTPEERAAIGLFARARAVATSAPCVRLGVVDRYRRLIADGRYHPDLEDVADRMIREGLLENLDK